MKLLLMNITEGLKKFKQFLASDPQELFIEALYLGFDDNYGEAVKVLDEALESSFGTGKHGKSLILVMKSFALSKLNRDEEALDAIEKAIENNEKSGFSWSVKGDILHDLDRQDESLKAYENALKYAEEEDEPEIIWNSADVLSRLGRHEEALEKLKEAAKNESDSAEIWFGISDELLELERIQESLEACKKGLEIDRDDVDLVIHYGNLMLELENYEEAQKYFEKATILDSTDEVAWYNKACVLSKLNQKEDALDALTVATGIDSENKELMKDEEDFENIRNEERFTRLLKQSL